jgi:hypothetical protein
VKKQEMAYDSEENVDFETNAEIDFCLCEEKKLRDGHYQIVFAQPETLISTKYGRNLLQSKTYQGNVLAMDHLHDRLNLDLNKSRQKFHHSLKEHHKISNIPKFRCEML